MANGIDLLSLFQTVQGVMEENRTSLNQADTHNNDHGDKMIDVFNLVTQAVGDKKSESPADQLGYAARLLEQSGGSSAELYAQGFSQASNQFKGEDITLQNGMQFVQALLGGGETVDTEQPDNPIGSLLTGFLGGGQSDDGGLDAGDLLTAGLAFMSAKSRGETNTEALVEALISASPFGNTPHRAQSSSLVAETLLDFFSNKLQK